MAAEKLRKQNSVTRQMQIFILTNYHREDQPQHREGRLAQFPMPIDSTLEMVKAAKKTLKELYRKGYGYKKAGVILYDIAPNTGIQAMMFDEIDRPKHKALMQTIDSLNAHHGRSTVALASQGTHGIPSNRDHLSPQYTTEWNDILVVKI